MDHISPHQLKEEVVKVGSPLKNFLDSRMPENVICFLHLLHNMSNAIKANFDMESNAISPDQPAPRAV